MPGTNGFIGEFLILLGAFKSNMISGTIAATGVIFSACYMLWMFQRVVALVLFKKVQVATGHPIF